MDEQLEKELIEQFYSVKKWTELSETKNFLDFCRVTKQTFQNLLSIELNVEKIRWYQGIIHLLTLFLQYPIDAMAAGELAEGQKYNKE